MRNASALCIPVLLAACAGGTTPLPVQLSAPTPDSTPVTLECVTRELENYGYETTRTESPPAVTGIRINEPLWFLQWLYGNTADQITATVDGGQLSVTAVSSHPDEIGEEGPPRSGASEAATRNAQSIVDTCS